MSGQKKIKDLTLRLKNSEEQCEMWIKTNILLSKRLFDIEELKKLLDDAMGLLIHHECSDDKSWQNNYNDICGRYEKIIT